MFHQIEYASRILHGFVDLSVTVVAEDVGPAGFVVFSLPRIVTGKQAFFEIVVRVYQKRRVRIILDLFVLNFVVRKQIIDQAAEKCNVRAGTYGRIIIRYRRRPVETGIDDNQFGLIMRLGFRHPFKTARVGFGSIAAHNQHQIGIFNVDPVIGHRAATERRGKTCHRRCVSDACLVIETKHPRTADNFMR